MGRAMLSKSLIQFSVDGRGCVPSLFLTWGQTGGGDEDNGDLLQKVPCVQSYTQCPQPCSRPLPTYASTRDSWTLTGSLGQPLGFTASFPGSWCARQEFVSQSLVSFGGSIVRLIATPSKRAHAPSRSVAPRAPAPVTIHC